MTFDFRVFLGESYDGKSQTVNDLLDRMDSLEIEMALACPFKPVSYDLDRANQDLANTIKPHKDRLAGAARIDPWQPGAVQTLERSIEYLGLKAVYLHPWEENFRIDIHRLDSIMGIVVAYKVPVIVAAGYPWVSEALQVCDLAARWPEVPIVMTNGGQINISGLGQADVTLALRKQKNLYIDTAGVYRQDFIEETIEEFGAGRVLFSSGAPYFDQRYELKRIKVTKVTKMEKDTISCLTAHQLLGIKN